MADLPPCLALARPLPEWRGADTRWSVEGHWRPEAVQKKATKDYRRSYPGVWALEYTMREVARPYLLRTGMARIGAELIEEALEEAQAAEATWRAEREARRAGKR